MNQPITRKSLQVFLSLFLIFQGNFSMGQCSGGTSGGALSPAPTGTFQTMSVSDGTYYTFVVPSFDSGCYTYTFTFCSDGGSAGFDTQLTILDNTGAYAGGYNDDNCGLQSEISDWSPAAPGTYRILVNTYNCTSSGNTATLAYIENSSAIGDYSLVGDAAYVEPCVTLTSNTTGQTGCAWDVSSTLNFAADFSYDFTVNLGSSDGGADGMAFVIQNDPSGVCVCGASGGGFGASGITNSLAIEIDTYLNTEDRDDGPSMDAVGVVCAGGPDPDHLDIWEGGTINPPGAACPGSPGARIIASAEPLLSGGADYNVENGLDHIFRISWSSGPGTLTATLLDDVGAATFGSVSHTFDPLVVFGTETPHFGFTAATGGLSNEQTWCNSPVLLSVEWTDFFVECGSENTNVSWTVAAQRNNDYFSVLRSVDGHNYEVIGTVDGAGTYSSPVTYVFLDENPPEGVAYYTLSQTDFNGEKTNNGRVLTASCESQHLFRIFPNPLQESGELKLSFKKSEDVLVTIYDVRGRAVFETFLESPQLELINPNLNSGVYEVHVTTVSGKKYPVEKLIVIE